MGHFLAPHTVYNIQFFRLGAVGAFHVAETGQSPIGRYWISSSVHTDSDNEETVGHRLPVATPSNIHHCWLNSRQLPIGRVSNLYPATFVHTQAEYNEMTEIIHKIMGVCVCVRVVGYHLSFKKSSGA